MEQKSICQVNLLREGSKGCGLQELVANKHVAGRHLTCRKPQTKVSHVASKRAAGCKLKASLSLLLEDETAQLP